MTAVLTVIVAAVAIGWLAAARFDVSSSIAFRAGTAYLLGSGLIAFAMFMLSILGLAWNRLSLLIALVVIAAFVWLATRRPGRTSCPPPSLPHPEGGQDARPTRKRRRFSPIATLADLLTCALVIGHGLYATAAAPFETDFLSIWGLKARVFAEHGGIDWSFLASPWNFFSHADYPLLLPLLYDAVAIVDGGWNDRWLGLLTTAFGAAGLLAVRGLLALEHSQRLAALMTLTLASMVLSPWIGMAEAPLIAYGTVALLLIRTGIARSGEAPRGGEDELWLGALLLACAVMTKNEGATLAIAATLAIVLSVRVVRWRLVRRLWPALAVAAVWLLITNIFGLENDLTVGSPAGRMMDADLRQLASLLWAHGGAAVPWVGFGIAALLTLPDVIRRERFLLAALSIQLMFYLVAYLVTPNGMEWQVRWSWARLLTHLLPLVAMAFLFSLSRILERNADRTTVNVSP